MWLATTIGFFSAVQKPGDDFLTIRARVREDLDNLRDLLPELSPTISGGGTDYPFRATASHEAFAAALGKIALDIDYSNFKNAVAASQGHKRAHRYHAVWHALFDLPISDPASRVKPALPWSSKIPAGKKVAYGGVVFDPAGLVLLREPKNHFDGYVWTFPKGRPNKGETPEQTALRETLEETGVQARIVAPIPGEFLGGTTVNRYFLMEADAGTGGVADDDPETFSVRWASADEAREMIGQSTNKAGRQRDLGVLKATIGVRADPFGQMSRSLISLNEQTTGVQARFLSRLIREMEQACLSAYQVDNPARLQWKWGQTPAPWDLPEVMRFIEGAPACGFVCEEITPDEWMNLDVINTRPRETLSTCGLLEVKRYVHTVHRADKWADCYSSPILEALQSGALQIVARRLVEDESLYSSSL